MKEALQTGTTTVGIKTKEGIILAADKRVTAGNFIAGKDFQKVQIVHPRIALTMAGLVSDAQLLTRLIKAELRLREVSSKVEIQTKDAANLLANMAYRNIRVPSMVPGIVGFLIAGNDTQGLHLYDIGVDGSVQERKTFVSDGSGSVYAYGVLETLYDENMTIDDARKLAVKAVNAALQRDTASGNGIDIVVIDKDGAKLVETQQLEKQTLNV